ncbi:MAG: capsule assembly Wzi family protein [Tannerellaceae bacterium]|nr:capsule assembly Wzi family protein [Tannerellaceae bacterium]
MKIARLLFILLSAVVFVPFARSQSGPDADAVTYEVEVQGSAATGAYTPFWIVGNRYGVVPLEAGNGYLRARVDHRQSLGNGFHWAAGVDALAVTPRYRNVYLQQLYAELGYKSLLLTVGSKEKYTSLWDRRLSSGDMIRSANARPVPEIHISIPEFLTVPSTKGWLHFKGYMSVGRSFDEDYLNSFIRTDQVYIRNILRHDKSLTLRLRDSRSAFPAYFSFGISHTAQWGGASSGATARKQPQSIKDFLRVFCAMAGGEGASLSDQVNVLGAHHISYNFQVGFVKEKWELRAYHQHIASDKSGVLFYNKADGLWGIQADFRSFPLIRKVLTEYVTTRNQSGMFHFINFDHDAHPGRGGGADDYYNNGEYKTGHTYFNRSEGSPLLVSPEYNEDGSLGFKSTRIRDIHFGMEGDISRQLSYRVLLTVMNGWGTPYRPFLKKQSGTSFLVEANYAHPRLSGWAFTGAFGGDTGNVTGNRTYGFSLGVSKRGILRY